MAEALIIDPPLRNSAGHHRALAFGWAAAAHEMGYAVRILGHRDWVDDSLDGFPAQRVFGGYFYGAANSRHLPLETQLAQRQSTFRDEMAKPLRGIRPDDVLVLTFPTTFILNGLAAWAGGLPEEQRPRLIVWLIYGPAEDEFATALGTTNVMVAAIDRLRNLFGERVSFLASTQGIAEDYRALGIGDFPVLPFAALRAPMPPRTAQATPDRPLAGVVGHIQPMKGSGQIAPLIEALVHHGVAARWLVAGSAEHTPEVHLDALHKLAKRLDGALQLDLRPNGLDDYDAVLGSLDLAVLPYSPEYYAKRGSGVAEEAALLGLPIVAPSVIAAGRPGAVSFDAWTPEAMSAAVSEALARLPELTKAARDAASAQVQDIRRQRMELLVRLFPEPDYQRADRPVRLYPLLDGEPGTAIKAESLPRVDVVVTLHNYRRFIWQCLDSVARQSYPHWRCIVVDDGSTDLTFAEGRALVSSFGPRFSYERHETAQGQLRAVATGVSLGSSPFVALLDADDYLDEQALDRHVAWHLNNADPVAMTSGGLVVVDVDGTRVASAMDSGIHRAQLHAGVLLSGDQAFVRPGGGTEHGTAILLDPLQTVMGQWFWNPTSTLMLRRSVLELIMPESADVGRYAADTYLGYVAHEVGGSVCFSAKVAYYRRHGDNGYSGAPVVGMATLPIKPGYPNWQTAAAVFGQHLRSTLPLFERNVAQYQIDRLLERTEARRAAPSVSALLQASPADVGMANPATMPYPQLLRYAARRLWRGASRRLRGQPAIPPRGGPDVMSFSELMRLVGQRTRRGVGRRFRR